MQSLPPPRHNLPAYVYVLVYAVFAGIATFAYFTWQSTPHWQILLLTAGLLFAIIGTTYRLFAGFPKDPIQEVKDAYNSHPSRKETDDNWRQAREAWKKSPYQGFFTDYFSLLAKAFRQSGNVLKFGLTLVILATLYKLLIKAFNLPVPGAATQILTAISLALAAFYIVYKPKKPLLSDTSTKKKYPYGKL